MSSTTNSNGYPSSAPFDGGATRQRNPSLHTGPQQQPATDPLEGRLTEMVWEVGRKQMNETLNSYGRIDIFRPYFNVEPKQVRNRLIQSFLPYRYTPHFLDTDNETKEDDTTCNSNDMYGPTMILFTMVALLLLSMKSFGYVVQDGTLIGTALVSCCTAWTLITLSLWICCYLLSANTQHPVRLLSMVGYSLFSHCLVILLVSLFHSSTSHTLFYVAMLLFCVPAALRLSLYLCSTIRQRAHKVAITLITFALHLGYLLYLHFGFHVMVEEIDEILGESTGATVMTIIHQK